MGATTSLIRPILALVVVALAATLLSIPARAGGGDPIAHMEDVVDHMEDAMEHVVDELEWKLEEADTADEQWAAYMDCVAQVEYMRDFKVNAIADIAGGDPELQEARQYYTSIINDLASEALQELAAMYEDADPPSTTTTSTVPGSTTTVPESTTTTRQTTTTTRPRNTTTTNPHQATTTTTTTPAPTSTVPPTTAPATSSTTTTTVAPPTTEFAAPPPPSTTTTVPSLFDGASDNAGAFAAVNQGLASEQIESLDAEATRLDGAEVGDEGGASPSGNLAAATAFDAQAGLMDGTVMMVDYVGSSLPASVAAPVISTVAVIEMIVRALLAGTQAFIGPSLVFGIYVGYRSLVTFVAHRRRGVAV